MEPGCFSIGFVRANHRTILLYFSILLLCIVQWVLQVMFPCVQFYCMLVFTVFHYMFRPTWPSSSVQDSSYIYFHMLKDSASLLFLVRCLFFHVVTLYMFFTCFSFLYTKKTRRKTAEHSYEIRTDFGSLIITSHDGSHIGNVEFQSLLPERYNFLQHSTVIKINSMQYYVTQFVILQVS
jgi:hypothetical protein